eukprot:TRINITY_DN56426_c0_g1_i1.p1 TRINITY_DN56426_c0_g1~~TRINITY_DN56426_c0_g1_i1.p1  ORF type:complete len:227 (+),score=21.66 TRINITY_DN56426_c0_g1_i1:27-707(+)
MRKLVEFLWQSSAVVAAPSQADEVCPRESETCCRVYIPQGAPTPFCSPVDGKNFTLVETGFEQQPFAEILAVGLTCEAHCGTSSEKRFTILGSCSSGADVAPTSEPGSCSTAETLLTSGCPQGSNCTSLGVRVEECVRFLPKREVFGLRYVRSCSAIIKNNADPGKPLRPNHKKMTCTAAGEGKPAVMMPDGWLHEAFFFCDSSAFLHCPHYIMWVPVLAMVMLHV